VLVTLGSIAVAAPLHAAPPETDPAGGPPDHPAVPAQGAAPETGEPPAATPPPDETPAFAPMPSQKKNPIDVLPGDVIYPPIDGKPVKPVLWDP